MKKAIIAVAAVIVFVVVAGVIVWTNLPFFISYAVSRATGITTSIEKAELGRRDGFLTMTLRNIRLAGPVEGRIGTWEMNSSTARPFSLTRILVSDFDVTINELGGGLEGSVDSPPATVLRIEKGYLNFQGQRFFITAVEAGNMLPGKPFSYSGYLKDTKSGGYLETTGEGLFEKEGLRLNGKVALSRIDLHHFTPEVKGYLYSTGEFRFARNSLSLSASFTVRDHVLNVEALKHPVSMKQVEGKLVCSLAKGDGELTVTDMAYLGIPLTGKVRFKDHSFSALEISSEVVDLNAVRARLSPEMQKGDGPVAKVGAIVESGQAKVVKVLYDKKKGYSGVFDVTGATVSLEDFTFTGASGRVHTDETQVRLEGFRCDYDDSVFRDIAGTIAYSYDGPVSLAGRYGVQLNHIERLLTGVADNVFVLKSGTTTGRFQVTKTKKTGFVIVGEGSCEEGIIVVNKVSARVRGKYRFRDDSVTLDPIFIESDDSSVSVRGTWRPSGADLAIRGTLAAAHFTGLIPFSHRTTGIVAVDGAAGYRNNKLEVRGTIGTERLSFEIPDLFSKPLGVPSDIRFVLTKEADKVHIGSCTVELGTMKLNMNGEIAGKRISSMRLVLAADSLDQVSPYFFATDVATKGKMHADLLVKDLSFPVTRLPVIHGSVEIRNGFFKHPGLKKPFHEMNFTARFDGETAGIDIGKIRCGSSMLGLGTVRVKNGGDPSFMIALDVDRFDTEDFKGGGGGFTPPRAQEGTLWHSFKGDISIGIKELHLGAMKGSGCRVKASYSQGRLEVSELKSRVMEGTADMAGIIDLSGPVPSYTLRGRLDNVQTAAISRHLSGNLELMEGRTVLQGNLSSRGATAGDLTRNMDGNMAFFAENGVIRRWNLLSKIFSILTLNFYDLFRGKMEFTAEGFPFKHMGATMNVRNGVIHTDDFVIDGHSMLMTGAGSIDLNKNEIDAKMSVYPLLVFDRTVDKIPLVRNILKGKKQGVIFASYTVTGPVADPKVSFDYADSFGKNAFDMLKNLILLPLEVVPK